MPVTQKLKYLSDLTESETKILLIQVDEENYISKKIKMYFQWFEITEFTDILVLSGVLLVERQYINWPGLCERG